MSYKVHNLWAVPVYQTKIKGVDIITEKMLINSEFSSFDEKNPTHLETPKRKVLDLPQLAGLKKQIQEHIDYYIHEVIGASREQQWTITTSWLNKSSPGGYHTMHWHSNSMLSGVYYLKTNPASGSLCLHKDRGHTNLWRDTLCIDFDKRTEYNTDCAINPEINDLILFPSIVNHSVLNNLSNEDRYSLAFNVWPRGSIGTGGNSELIT